MTLFAFGLGYSALHFIRTRRDRLGTVAGTVRGAAKAAELGHSDVRALVFGPEAADPAIGDAIAGTDTLLVSIPPGERDPVLERFATTIASAPGLRSIVYLSTVGVYGDHGGAWVDEEAELRPVSARSRERVEAETAWLDLGRRAAKSVQVLRLGGIYGAGRSALEKVADGSARRLVKPGQVFNRIHVEDIARAIEAALGHATSGQVWNTVDDEPAPPQDVIAFAAYLMGVPPPPEIPFAGADLPPMARSFYGENKRVSNDRLKRKLGVRLAFPTYRAGLQALWEERFQS